MTPDDSARNRKMRKMMSLNCSICLMPIFGVGKVYRIWTPKGGPPSCVESLLLKQNPTLIYLHNVKSFVVFRAGRKVPHCQKWDCHALPLFALDRAISRLFSISILIAGETKNGRAKSTRWSVWQSCFWGCDMTLGTHPGCFKSSPETMKPQKAGRMTQTSTC